MSLRSIFVFDTNALISAALSKNSISAKAYDHAVITGSIAISEPLLTEFTDVLFRKKLDRYFLNEEERLEPIFFLEKHALEFEIHETIIESKDPDDNMILELAVASNASCMLQAIKNTYSRSIPFEEFLFYLLPIF